MQLQGQVGPQVNANGSVNVLRTAKTGEALVTEMQARFYENAYRNNLFSIGCAQLALSAATILLTASAQPILGVWNPPTSGVNLVILQAALQIAAAPNSATVTGAFVWASSLGNTNPLTAGLTPFSRNTLANAGSQAKAFALSTASLLTGLVNNLVIFEAADFGPLVVAQGATGTPIITPASVQNFDGSLIVPPGAVLALLNTTSNTTVSVAGRLLWAEVSV